jgi:hypothetical protein
MDDVHLRPQDLRAQVTVGRATMAPPPASPDVDGVA